MENSIPNIGSREELSLRKTNFRWIGGGLVLFICFVAYIDRSALAVSAVPIMKSFHLSPVQFGFVNTLFSIAYLLLQIPGAVLGEKVGARKIITAVMILWSIFTAMTGFAGGFITLAIARFLFGAAEAPLFPNAGGFITDWFPKRERARAFALMSMGAFVASLLAPPFFVAIVSRFGWQSSFYVCGAIGIIAAIIWYQTVRSTPEEHPRISKSELQLITENRFETEVVSSGNSHWKSFLRQRSFWMMGIGGFSSIWLIQFFVFWLPYYLQAVRHLSFQKMGVYASFPWITALIFMILAGFISDWIIKRGASRFWARNMINVIALAIAAIALLLSNTATTATGDVLWISLAIGMAGAVYTTTWSMVGDLGQKHAASVGSWVNMWGFTAGAIMPTLAPFIAERMGWSAVFVVNSGIAILGIFAFLLVKIDRPLKTDSETI